MRWRNSWKYLLALIFPCLAAGQVADSPLRFAVREDPQHGWGFIDQTGTLVIPYQFAAVGEFHDGLAPVLVKAQWGYIDPAGKIVIQPQFVDAAPFSENMAAVRVHDDASLIKDPWGYIDRTGKLVIAAKYGSAAPFSYGRARVNFENKLLFIDPAGKAVPFPEGMKKAYGDFSENLAAVGDNRSAATGYIDPDGKLVIPAQPGLGAPFSEGLAAAILSTGKFPHVVKTLNFIDPTGKTVVQTEFSPNASLDDPIHFSEGLCRILHVNRKATPNIRYLYLDKTGKIAIELAIPDLHKTSDFHEGLAHIKVGGDANSGLGGKFGYIDTAGKVVIPPQYDYAEDFHNGLAQTVTANNQSYINKSGHSVYPPASAAKEH